MMKHTEILGQTINTLRERGVQYGPEEACFERIATLASIVLNKSISPYDIAMILHCVQLGSLQENRNNPKNYIDGVAYLALGGQFANLPNSVSIALEDDITAMASKLAPLKYAVPKKEPEMPYDTKETAPEPGV